MRNMTLKTCRRRHQARCRMTMSMVKNEKSERTVKASGLGGGVGLFQVLSQQPVIVIPAKRSFNCTYALYFTRPYNANAPRNLNPVDQHGFCVSPWRCNASHEHHALALRSSKNDPKSNIPMPPQKLCVVPPANR